mgnify:CR=1 FL=1
MQSLHSVTTIILRGEEIGARIDAEDGINYLSHATLVRLCRSVQGRSRPLKARFKTHFICQVTFLLST